LIRREKDGLFKADFADKFDATNQNFEIVEEIEINP